MAAGRGPRRACQQPPGTLTVRVPGGPGGGNPPEGAHTVGMDSSLGVPPVWGLWRDVAPQVLTTLPHTAALLPFAPLGPRLSGAWDSGGTAVFWAHGSLGPGAFWGPWLFEAHSSLLPAFFWAAWGLWGTAAFWGPWSFSAWVFWGAPSSLGPVAFGAQSFTGPIALWGCIPLRRPHSSAGVPPCHGSGEISAVGRSSDRSPGPGCAHRSTKGSPGPGGRLGRVSVVFLFAY